MTGKLKEWDMRMMLHEILEKQNYELIGLQRNQDPLSREAFEEIKDLGEMAQKLPHLQQLNSGFEKSVIKPEFRNFLVVSQSPLLKFPH